MSRNDPPYIESCVGCGKPKHTGDCVTRRDDAMKRDVDYDSVRHPLYGGRLSDGFEMMNDDDNNPF